MRIDKITVLKEIVELHKINPPSPDFENKVVSVLREKIAQETNLDYVAPETFAKVDQVASNFTSDMKKLWRSPKVCVHFIFYDILYSTK